MCECMTESFAQLFEESLANKRIRPGMILTGLVVEVTDDVVIVNVGLKSEAVISIDQFKNERGELEVKQGDEVEVALDSVEDGNGETRLSREKAKRARTWTRLETAFNNSQIVTGVITGRVKGGFTVEIEDGVEGLVHVSEMDWTNKNVNPAKVVHTGQEVEVMVLDVDEERRRISLGLKQCQANPWKEFAENYNRGDKVTGQIKSITDFGIFIGLSGNIDGLVHLSDISWDLPGEEAVRNYQKGQQLEAMVLSIDPERERISLGIKQLAKDPFSAYIAENPKGTIVRGTVKEVDARGAIIDLGNGVEGQLRASELGRDRVEDARTVLKEGEEIEAKFTGVDRKSRTISLSIKAKEIHEEAEAVQSYRSSDTSSSGTSLGDLLKEKIGGGDRD